MNILITAIVTLFGTASVYASPRHEEAGTDKFEVRQQVDRTIQVNMGDIFFDMKTLDIKRGETVRFVLKNEGALLHEFNLGSAESHAQHQKEMIAMFQRGTLSMNGEQGVNSKAHSSVGNETVNMAHNDPNSVLVKPGSSEELIWTFSNATNLEFACNIPGHYQSGMVGKIIVR
ncbi:plastocyanin/azurin family copper-binding protein [Pseudomonas sp. NPDC078700]|uniref:cupredoxin domain-containing protein n=1 Tax=Pseudomonas sp. NPDC078700 TaxID=3364424 RepID=UPI0037CBBCD1